MTPNVDPRTVRVNEHIQIVIKNLSSLIKVVLDQGKF